jgi:hypothetical protein
LFDAALFAWLWAIQTAIPLETIAYAAILVVTVWHQQNQGTKWQERIHSLEQSDVAVRSALNALNQIMEARLAGMHERLEAMERRLDRLVIVGAEPDTSESSSSDQDE